MGEFTATDIAFEGFRVGRERPKMIASWAIVMFLMAVVQAVAIARFGGQAFTDMMELARQPTPSDPSRSIEVLRELSRYFAIILPASLVTYAILMTAANRVILDPDHVGFGFKLGMQELRQGAVIVIVSLIQFSAYLLIILTGFVLAGLAGAVSPALGALLVAVTLVAVVAALVHIAVRLSLAGPQTFDEGRIRIMDSWRLTKTHFWPMIGAYLLAVIFAIVVSVLGMLVLQGFSAVVGGALAPIAKPEAAKLSEVFAPTNLVVLALEAILQAFSWSIVALPAPYIYQQLRDRRAAARS